MIKNSYKLFALTIYFNFPPLERYKPQKPFYDIIILNEKYQVH